MEISVIITVYNRFEYVENILKCLIKQTTQPYEVIFTDDGSKEDLKEILKKYKDECEFKIKYIYQEDLGFRKSKACNNAVIESEGDYLIFLDQDAIFPDNLIETFIQNKKENKFSILRVIWSENDERIDIQKILEKNNWRYDEIIQKVSTNHFKVLKKYLWRDKYNNFRYRIGMRDRGTGLMGIGFALFKKDYLAINGYDEDYKGWGGEDADLGLRLYALGLKSVTFSTKIPSIHMCHPLDPTKSGNQNKKIYREKREKISKGNYKCVYGLNNRKDEDGYIYEEI